jgi:ADP-heptose:LPS heptosyltransferase
MIPELDGVLTVSASWQQLPGAAETDAAAERALLDRLVAGRYDVLLVLTSFSQSPWPVAHLGLLAGIGIRVVHSREFGGAVATHWVTPPPDTTHQVDRALHLLAAIGVPHRGRDTSLHLPAETEEAASVLAPPTPFAVLAPGASCPSRRYPADRFRAVARGLARSGLPVAVSGPGSERDLVSDVVAGEPGVLDLAGALDVPGLAGLLAGAAVAITNNSGGAHLADAVGTPVAVLFAGTEQVEQFAPRSVRSAVLGVPTPCTPCRQLRCPFELQCLDVPPDEVVAAALRLRRN